MPVNTTSAVQKADTAHAVSALLAMQSVEELVDSVLAGVPAPVREGSTVASRLPHGLSHNTQYLESESSLRLSGGRHRRAWWRVKRWPPRCPPCDQVLGTRHSEQYTIGQHRG